jgi:hypothetical protein
MSVQDERSASLMRRIIDGMFPQFAVNRIFPRQPLKVGRGRREKIVYPYRWLHRPLTLEQVRWVANRAIDYWFRWFIAFGASLFLSVKIGPPYGAFVHLGFTFFAAWTLIGVAVAVGRNRKTPRIDA